MTRFAGRYSIAMTVAMRMVRESSYILFEIETMNLVSIESACAICVSLIPLLRMSSCSLDLRMSSYLESQHSPITCYIRSGKLLY
jgi:hypothetical protein